MGAAMTRIRLAEYTQWQDAVAFKMRIHAHLSKEEQVQLTEEWVATEECPGWGVKWALWQIILHLVFICLVIHAINAARN
eukprot:NODE_5943_length_296_cov_211.668016_g5331_i0.p1 GENE.NODE_5943_length_296_cov_211.668016_g5331_i0~~NODE_5943_length_296_cov_211.668016_g5331_i0.p1  ORF type:complete len:87 (-),score=21.67 NODE_5943_length_296_cov_211.668016_g5331_i0:36-275(-)